MTDFTKRPAISSFILLLHENRTNVLLLILDIKRYCKEQLFAPLKLCNNVMSRKLDEIVQ